MFNLFKNKEVKHARRGLFATMLAFGIFGLIASFTLAVEEFHLLKDPNAALSCSFNLVLNCSVVMQTWQASVFGFPNMYIGLMAYPMVIMIALLGLSNVSFPRWFNRGILVGYALGALFAYWLFFNSLYVIEVLCPWCLVVTFSTTILLETAVRHNLRENSLALSKGWHKKVQTFLDNDFDKLIVASWVVLLVALVILKFGKDLVA